MKIIVIGKNGQLAWELARLKKPNVSIICFGRHEIDITDKVALKNKLIVEQADAVINASAYTAVDLAESESEQAYLINATAVGYLADVCAELTIHLTHISTDFVFDGQKTVPYLCHDPQAPLSIYGASKARGEQYIAEKLPTHSCILRTSWVYSIHGNNFVKTMLRLMAEKPELNVINDQVGTPTYAKGLAQACFYAAVHQVTGIHHWTDTGIASWYDFARAIQEFGLEAGLLTHAIKINAVTHDHYPSVATRPCYSVLDKSSLATAFPDLVLRDWRSQLHNMIKELDN